MILLLYSTCSIPDNSRNIDKGKEYAILRDNLHISMPATFTIEHPVQEETLKEITKTFLGLRPTRNSIPTLVFEPTDGVIQTIE